VDKRAKEFAPNIFPLQGYYWKARKLAARQAAIVNDGS
jgi:hypothetical protein